MNDAPRQILQQIITQYSHGMCNDHEQAINVDEDRMKYSDD